MDIVIVILISDNTIIAFELCKLYWHVINSDHKF
jgi:hypothetical protein